MWPACIVMQRRPKPAWLLALYQAPTMASHSTPMETYTSYLDTTNSINRFHALESIKNMSSSYYGLKLLIELVSPHLVPYVIILVNFIAFKLLRSFVNKIINYYVNEQQDSTVADRTRASANKLMLLKLFIDELISTCELCADCAELNVVYEKHGSTAYGAILFLLTYLWVDAFGEAHTTPGYLAEDYFLVKGNQLLRTGEFYARFIGQSIAMPLAWRFASFYWKYQLLDEHKEMLVVENCKSSLSTSTINGFLIEFSCCLLCRLIELYGHELLERRKFSQRIISMTSSFICTVLVVLALELSGGYFNPVLASSLEYGCKGINFYQHAIVFWIGPLLGHIMARGLFKRIKSSAVQVSSRKGSSTSRRSSAIAGGESTRRLTRSHSKRKKHVD